uniref:Immunoglobulin V-set domain-containing protein n=1 Tax=Felis catus TaxID=9685 RepID=A0ABI7YZB6_FELCA
MQSGLPALLCTVVAFIHFGSSKTQSITQYPSSVHKREKQSVTLDCIFTLSYTYYVMSFFQQLSNGNMTEIINLNSARTNTRKGRYSVSHQKGNKALKLTITGLMSTDSGVYFCAVREL